MLRHAVACLLQLSQQGTFYCAYGGLYQASAACPQRCCGTPSRVVAFATRHTTYSAFGLYSAMLRHAVACRLLLHHGTFHCACAGLHQASAASTQRYQGTPSQVVAFALWHTIYNAFGLYTVMFRHAVVCRCFWNAAHFIVPMLACIRQAQPVHSDAVARCRL